MQNTDFNWQMIIVLILGIMLILALYRFANSLWGREDISQTTKLLWTILFVLAPFLGFILYLIFGGRSDFEVEDQQEEDAMSKS